MRPCWGLTSAPVPCMAARCSCSPTGLGEPVPSPDGCIGLSIQSKYYPVPIQFATCSISPLQCGEVQVLAAPCQKAHMALVKNSKSQNSNIPCMKKRLGANSALHRMHPPLCISLHGNFCLPGKSLFSGSCFGSMCKLAA